SLEELSDLCTPWCIHVVGTLRVAEQMAAGVDTADGLAAAVGCNAYALRQVMGHLVDKGVFNAAPDGRYKLNEVSEGLLDPARRPDLGGIGGRTAHAWGTLLHYVQTGEPGYAQTFGLPFWDDLAAHPDVAESFDDLMGPAGHGTPNADFPLTGGWQAIRTVVDVGGGTGAMLAEILRLHPHIRGTLVDLPGTVARSGDTFRQSGTSERVTTIGQSFFDPLPPGGDLYLLRKVLGNWPERETAKILRRCAEAAAPAGRVIVLGGIVPDGTPDRLTIETVLLGGKTDAISEFRALAYEAGLEVIAATQVPGSYYVVECRVKG
ncbi:MAG: hydroxyneurosporene-O-methyltransferase, partial [Paenibacillaceae bacterium]|nr:hydroxyneurosporene-O-methyltransferase [Paenibacillaceae bacterium]